MCINGSTIFEMIYIYIYYETFILSDGMNLCIGLRMKDYMIEQTYIKLFNPFKVCGEIIIVLG